MNTEYLKQYNKVLVIGHLTPDTDTITSSYILSKIFKSFGINSDYAVLETEKINSKTAKQLNEVMTYSPFILKESEIKNYHYFLVDHNDVSQSVKDASLVVGCIDHHPDSKQIPNAIIKDFCSTTLLIYDLFKDIYNFTDEDKKVIYMGALDDSACGFSPRYNYKAKKQILELGFDNYLKDKFEDYYIPTEMDDQVFPSGISKKITPKLYKLKDTEIYVFFTFPPFLYDSDNGMIEIKNNKGVFYKSPTNP